MARLDFAFHYTIIASGPLYSELQTQIQHLKLSDRVSILQDVADDQKYQLLRDSHVFLFPSISKSEAYGLSQVEALYFSLPIVNTMLNNGVNYLVPPYDAISLPPKKASSLASALTLLFNSSATFISLSALLYSLQLSPVAINRKLLISLQSSMSYYNPVIHFLGSTSPVFPLRTHVLHPPILVFSYVPIHAMTLVYFMENCG